MHPALTNQGQRLGTSTHEAAHELGGVVGLADVSNYSQAAQGGGRAGSSGQALKG